MRGLTRWHPVLPRRAYWKVRALRGAADLQPAGTLLFGLALLQCGARVLPLNPQLPTALLQELLPALTIQHQLVLNGDTRCREFTGVNSAGGRRRVVPLLAWRTAGVDDVNLRLNPTAEGGGT